MLNMDFYNIVVAGAMNPRIHHPSWYQLVKIITKEEAEEALASSGTFGIQGMTQLNIPSSHLTIICNEQRWEVQTDSRANLERIQNISWEVFDKYLVHTPVNVFGLNFNFQRSTNCTDVPVFLANQVVAMGVGLDGDAVSDADITLRSKFDDHTSQVSVQKSPTSKQDISVSCHYEYPVGTTGGGFFSLKEKIAERIGSALKDAEAKRDLVVQAINEKAKS